MDVPSAAGDAFSNVRWCLSHSVTLHDNLPVLEYVRALTRTQWQLVKATLAAAQKRKKRPHRRTCSTCRGDPDYDGIHSTRECPNRKCTHCGQSYSTLDPATGKIHGPSNLCRKHFGAHLELRSAGGGLVRQSRAKQ